MSELITYYEKYKSEHGDDAYRMETAKGTSRVRLLQQQIRKYVPVGGKILDIGCGDMYLAKTMPEYTWEGVDIAPDMSDGRAKKQDLMSTPYPFEAGTFDACVCSEVLEHLWDLRVVHREAKRLLKPQGTYLVSTPNFDHIDHKLSGYRELVFDPSWTHHFEHIRFYTPDSHTRDLTVAGFDVVDRMGSDAHFSKFFAKPRQVLLTVMRDQLKLPVDVGTVDMILGAMWPDVSHTTHLVAKPGKP